MSIDKVANSPRRLKILWLSHLIPYPPKSGVLMRSYHLVRQLAKHHDLDLFAFNQSRQFKSHFPDQAAGLTQVRKHFEEFTGRFHVESIPCETQSKGRARLALKSLITRDPYTINWLKSKSAAQTLESWLAETHYDLIHFDTISLAPYVPRATAARLTLDHHNIESHMMLRRAAQESSRLKSWYFHQEGARLLRYEREHLGKFDGHIVCSEEDRRRLTDVVPGLAVKVVANGILMSDERPMRSPTRTPPKLLFIGGLDWYPNTDAVHYLLDEIWPRLRERQPDIEVDIIGKHPTQKMLDHARADRHVRVHGFVDDIRPFYEQATAYVCPIRDGGGTKLKVLDALAHRLPVVAHPAACEGLPLEDRVNVRVATTPNDFAAAIAEIVASPHESERLGDAGYSLVREQFDFRNIGLDLASFCSELCSSARVSR